MNNLMIAQKLHALAEAVKKASPEWGSVGVGGDTVEKLAFIEHENVQVFELRLTPPPLGTGQNVVHSNDDDGNDGVFLAKIARLEAKIDGLDSDIASLIDMVRRG